MRKFYLIILVLFTASRNFAQQYFQQEVNYKINVALNDVTHELLGNIEIEYKNNSSEKLEFIYMHLWPNAYKNNTTALAKQIVKGEGLKFHYADSKDRGFIDQLDFTSQGEKLLWDYVPDNIDIAKISLKQALVSGGSITIKTPFHVKIPSAEFSRLGHIDQSYMITQWYPKPAVYDKNGWHPINYLNQGEFYSEFGCYDVSITLPENYVVGATGDLQNPEEIIWLDTKTKEDTTNWYNSKSMEFPASSKKLKTIQYKQKNVHDFAWFADKRFHVLKGEVELPRSKRKVTTWAMFTNSESNLWKNSIEYLNDATYYYSLWNGEYPYNQVTAIDGTIAAGGGMEYPNITVIGKSGNAFGLETVIMHEVGHNWFYGILGSNERDHAWMDEGINSANEMRYVYTKYPETKLGRGLLPKKITQFMTPNESLKYKDHYYYSYLFSAKKNIDQPLALSSDDFIGYNYAAIVYSKTASIFQYLKTYLGDEKYDECMQYYFETWKFKHPRPEDLQKCFEVKTGQNLAWIFDGLINTKQKIDFKITSVKKQFEKTGNDQISIQSKYSFKGPVFIGQMMNDSLLNYKILNFTEKDGKILFDSNPLATSYRIDPLKDIPELNRNNNIYKLNGLFKKIEPVQFKFFGKIESGKSSNLYLLPFVGWNNYDKWMPGLSIYNSFLFSKPFEYRISPMYSFDKNRITGFARLGYRLTPDINNSKTNIKLDAKFSRFSLSSVSNLSNIDKYYNRFEPSVNLEFINSVRKNYRNNVTLGAVVLNFKEIFSNDFNTKFISTSTMLYAKYDYKNINKLIPQKGNLMAEVYADFSAMSADYTIGYAYNKKKKRVEARVFAGTILTGNGSGYWRLSGQNGSTDPRYEDLYFGRLETSGVMGSQFKLNHGGFKTPTKVSSGKWMIGTNFRVDTPFFIGLFTDVAIVPLKEVAENRTKNTAAIYIDAGFYLPIIRNEFEIYFPLGYNQNVKDLLGSKSSLFQENIRFVLNLDFFNPSKATEKF